MRLLCKLGIHKFNNWKTVKIEKFKTLNHMTDERKCIFNNCNKKQTANWIVPKKGYDNDPDKRFYPYTHVC